MLSLFRKPDPLPLRVRKPAFTESAVTGKRTLPSKPFDARSGDTRWSRTDLGETFRNARAEQ